VPTTTYYRSSEVLVTNDVFVWRAASPPRVFRVRDLADVGVVRGAADPYRVHTVHVASGLAVVAVTAWPLVDSPALAFVGVALVGVPLAAAVATGRSRARTWELRASYAGFEVVLYGCTDHTTFGQVSRALQRSLEANDPPSRYELAGG
jgi:hypothetical protein